MRGWDDTDVLKIGQASLIIYILPE